MISPNINSLFDPSMINPDIINGLFELVGSYFTWMNAWVLWRASVIAGVYWQTTLFFTLWGVWNLIYYPMLDQWFSFYAGVLLVLGNVVWVGLVLKYKER